MMLSRMKCYDCGKRCKPVDGQVVKRYTTDDDGNQILVRAWVCGQCIKKSWTKEGEADGKETKS